MGNQLGAGRTELPQDGDNPLRVVPVEQPPGAAFPVPVLAVHLRGDPVGVVLRPPALHDEAGHAVARRPLQVQQVLDSRSTWASHRSWWHGGRAVVTAAIAHRLFP
ncbi:hypothetical protein [Amycolatopsis sp.]|uniref:hypothetical protein n=1 Tax=Amycolatopsis sp. TaxID=37632 RepID=UPI0039C898D8